MCHIDTSVQYVRQKVRELAHFLIEFRNFDAVESLQEAVDPTKYKTWGLMYEQGQFLSQTIAKSETLKSETLGSWKIVCIDRDLTSDNEV